MNNVMNVIVICPCCATPKDAAAGDDEQHFTCMSCNQKWAMVVDPDRQKEHALT